MSLSFARHSDALYFLIYTVARAALRRFSPPVTSRLASRPLLPSLQPSLLSSSLASTTNGQSPNNVSPRNRSELGREGGSVEGKGLAFAQDGGRSGWSPFLLLGHSTPLYSARQGISETERDETRIADYRVISQLCVNQHSDHFVQSNRSPALPPSGCPTLCKRGRRGESE